MFSTVSIRPATHDDLDTIQTIYNNALSMRVKNGALKTSFLKDEKLSIQRNQQAKEKLATSMQRTNFRVLLAEHTHPVGFLAYELKAPYATIQQFYTEPSDHKYGRQLMEAFYTIARSHEVRHIDLISTKYGMPIYKKWGYEPFYEDSIQMYKYLDPNPLAN